MSATERTKLHLAIGQLSLEYEGDESFSKDDLVDLLGQLSDVHARSGSTPAPLQESSPDDSPAPKTQPNLSVDTIAARLHANSGPELDHRQSGVWRLAKSEGTPTTKDSGGRRS